MSHARDLEQVWRRIRAHAGEVFRQKRGKPFTYRVRGNSVVPSTTDRMLPKRHFEEAWRRMPVSGPGALQDLQGPSYLWAILTDSRIAAGPMEPVRRAGKRNVETTRRRFPSGNRVTGSATGGPGVYPPSGAERRVPVRASPSREDARFRLDLDRTIVVLPCSGGKRRGGCPYEQVSITAELPPELAEELVERRRHNAGAVRLDEMTLCPAAERYSGTLYREGCQAIHALQRRGAKVVIISGGYGVVLSDEPIGWYEATFRPALWPDQLVERCLAAFTRETAAEHVVGVLSRSTAYARVFARVRWPNTLSSVHLLSPVPSRGAMVKAPRAQGQAVAQIAATGLLPGREWVSSDSLGLETTRLV